MGQQVLALYAFLEAIQLPAALEARSEALLAQENPSWPGSTASCGASSAGALEQCYAMVGEMPSDLGEFARLLRLLLSRYTVGTIPASLDRVTVGTRPRLGGAAGKVLFLLGAEDGAIPQVTLGAGLLTDRDRELLEDYGLALSPGWRKSWTGRAPSSTPSAPNPRRSSTSPGRPRGRGREKRPAFLVDTLTTLFPQWGGRAILPCPPMPFRPWQPRTRRPGQPWTGKPPARPSSAAWTRRQAGPGAASPQAVEALYGKKVAMSASRMDQYQSCHFAYFLRYGLQAKDRRPAGFDAPAYGSFVHFVLGGFSAPFATRGGAAQAEEETIRAPHRPGGGGLRPPGVGGWRTTPRFRYLFYRLERVQAVVDNVVAEPGTPTSSPSALSWASAQGKTCPRWRSPRGASPPDLRFRGPGGRLGEERQALPPGGGLQDRPETLTSPRCGTAWGCRCSSTSSPWRRRGRPSSAAGRCRRGCSTSPARDAMVASAVPWTRPPDAGRWTRSRRVGPHPGPGGGGPGHGARGRGGCFLPLRVSARTGRSPGGPGERQKLGRLKRTLPTPWARSVRRSPGEHRCRSLLAGAQPQRLPVLRIRACLPF